jgi:hypothetical protein
MKMKKRTSKAFKTEAIDPDDVTATGDQLIPGEDVQNDNAGDITMDEFLKIKKLQNQILEKMLENINKQGPEQKSKKSK